MHSPLAATGTADLLKILSPLIPDEFINRNFLRRRTPGRPLSFSPAQLWRAHLLSLLTPVHSFNLLVKVLPEQTYGGGLLICHIEIGLQTYECLTSLGRVLVCWVFER